MQVQSHVFQGTFQEHFCVFLAAWAGAGRGFGARLGLRLLGPDPSGQGLPVGIC